MITSILRVLLTKSFKPLVFTNKVEEKLNLGQEDFGLYVHIPFCTTLCDFCPYNKVKYDKNLVKSYKEALLNEIDRGGELYPNKNINSLYFGGGTPALMLEDLGDIMACLKRNFNIKGNVGIELHPRDINENTLKKLKEASFDMVSIGIQSFQRECLNSLGREYIDGASKVLMVKEAGFKVIDVDLIFGMENQNKEALQKDLITAFQGGATQVSTYPFIDFSYANNKSRPLGRKKKKELLKSIEEASNNVQWERTSVWTFGKRSTSKYSSITRDTYLGFGPSAASLTNQVFQINTFSLEEYINRVNSHKSAGALAMRFTKRTRALYWLFWNAYTLKLENSTFYKLFNKNLEDVFPLEISLGKIFGLIKKAPEGYRLTKRGAYIYHLMEQRYTHEYIDKTWRITRENPWPEEIRLY